MRFIFRVLEAVLCVLAIGIILQHPDKYPRIVRVAYASSFAAVGVAVLVDWVWPIRCLVLIAVAGWCLVWEIVLVLSPSAGWPQQYVRTLKVGWAGEFVAFSLMAGVRMGLLPLSLAFLVTIAVIAILSLVVIVVAYSALRPKGRPWNGVF